MQEKDTRIFKRDGIYNQICIASGLKPRNQKRVGYFTRDELMQILLILKSGQLGVPTCKKLKK